jgi:formylglycine-generating enzyme required for sulfatase activity
VTAGGVIGIVLQDAGDYSLLLPVERIIQLFTAWGLPVNLLTSPQTQPDEVFKGKDLLKPKDVFKECDKCPEMVVVPAGSFDMGSPRDEEGHDPVEEPRHKVTIAQPFSVGRFAVTFDEWDACVAGGGCNRRLSDQGWGRGRRPVINVTWDDAKAYASWLSQRTGKPYRLLTEAEREYIARAGTASPFWFGFSISTERANYNGNYTYNRGVKGEWRKKTVTVDAFEQSNLIRER